jgi:hypothetical protein
METASSFTNFTNFLNDSSSATMGEFASEQELQQKPNLTIPNDRLKLYLDRWRSISIYFDNRLKPNDVLTIPDRLTNQFFGRDTLNTWINDKAKNAPTIERVREITANLPSLTKLLLDDRNNE